MTLFLFYMRMNYSNTNLFFFDLISYLKKDKYLEELNNFSKEIKFKASKDWTAKFIPNLKFIFDDSFDYAEKIENLIKQNKKDQA